MNIEARKISLAQRLFMVQQESMLDMIEELLNQKVKLSDAEKKAVDIGLESLENGRRIPHEEVMQRLKDKYPNFFK